MHFQLLSLFACGGNEEVQMLPTNSFSGRDRSTGKTVFRRISWNGQCLRWSVVTGAGSAGDGHWSLERAVLEMVTGAGSARDGRWSLERAALEMVAGHWSGQCWRWSLVTGAGSAGDGHWSGQCR